MASRRRLALADELGRRGRRVTALAATRPRLTVTAFWRLAPTPTPDPAGLDRWIARAHRLLASGQIGRLP